MINSTLLHEAVMASTDGIVIADVTREDMPLVFVNRAFERITGYSAEEALHRNCRFLQGRERDQAELGVLRNALANGIACTVTLRNYRRDGQLFWNELSVSPVFGADGRTTHYVGILKDITLRAQSENELRLKKAELEAANLKLQWLNVRDPLTGIYNRRHFTETLDRAWRMGQREARPVSALLIDIDFFKHYNDCHGHRRGDECLSTVARALQGAFRRGGDTVARYGGEEFAAITSGSDAADALELAEHARQEVAALAIVHERPHSDQVVTVSVGVATLIPSADTSPEMLLELADRALYDAKAAGRNRVVTATPPRLPLAASR